MIDRLNKAQERFPARLVRFVYARVLQHLLEHGADLLMEDLLCVSTVKVWRVFSSSTQSACLASVSSARMSLPLKIASRSAASSPFRREGSTARPMTSIRPMFSFLMWCSFACG